jgi:ABC-type uncharacterized transport system substrate-binding protein
VRIYNCSAIAQTVALCITLFISFCAEAQQPNKIARIGFLGNTSANDSLKPFRGRLHELGYTEGQNIVIEPRYYEGKIGRLPDLASELVGLNCDIIYTIGNEAAQAGKNATKEIPIIISNTSDAVRSGFVASLARPGGNITGLTSIGGELAGKRLALLQEVIPKLSRVGFLWSPTSPTTSFNLNDTEAVARSLGVDIQSLEVKDSDGIARAFQRASSRSSEALLVDAGGFFAANQNRLIDLALKHRLPASYSNARYVQAGGLMTYGPDRLAQYRRAADYADKILKGAKPANLPVERPQKFELVINLKTAKQIGLTIPPNVLARADQVIR